MAYASTNPFTGEVVATFPDATDAEVDVALERAQAAFEIWSRTALSERTGVLARAAELILERQEELAALATLEMGKLHTEAMAEVQLCSHIMSYIAQNAEWMLEGEDLRVAPASGHVSVQNEPLGIVFSIEPWNVPFFQALRPFVPNMALGNVVILKHSSIVPQCAAAIVKLLRDAGLPDGVWTNLYLTHPQTERVIADRRVRGVTITGSTEAGRRIAAMAGKAMKKSVMELGGSDAFIVLDAADLDLTVACSVPARLYNGGQVCISAKRMIVVDALYDEFLARMTEAFGAARPGDPNDPQSTLPPMSSQGSADTINAQIEAAIAAGATAVRVGAPIPERGAFVQPIILTDVTRDNPVYYDEIFGPVVMVFRVRDEAEAIALANDSHFGLAGSVWTKDIERGRRVASQIDTGTMCINQPAGGGPDIPTAGTKDSGYGFEFGRFGMLEFARRKIVIIPSPESSSLLTG